MPNALAASFIDNPALSNPSSTSFIVDIPLINSLKLLEFFATLRASSLFIVVDYNLSLESI